jgi:HlyD family secretion protein
VLEVAGFLRLSHQPARHSRHGRISALLLASLVANAGLAGALGYFYTAKPKTESQGTSLQATAVAITEINALGRLQPASGIINIFGPPGDRITEVLPTLRASVKKGEVLLRLSGERERQLALDALDAQLEETQAIRTAAEKGKIAKLADVDAEIRQGKAKVDAEMSALDAKLAVVKLQEARAGVELARLQKAQREGGPVAEQQLAELRTLSDTAKTELAAIEVQKTKALEQQTAGELAAKAKRATLEAETERLLAQIPTESLKKSRELAAMKLAEATVKAPIAGRIVKLAAKPGDTLTTMPVLQIADTTNMQALAEVYESEVPKLREWLQMGKKVTVEIDTRIVSSSADAKKLTGTVTLAGISPMIAKNSVFPLDPRADADRRVVEVEVNLDAVSAKQAADFLGLQVTVKFSAAK